MKTMTKTALLSTILLAIIFSRQGALFCEESKPPGKTLQQYLKELYDDDPQISSQANSALKKMSKEAESYQYDTSQQCIKQLKNKNGYVRLWSVQSLGKMGIAAKDAIPTLLDAYMDNGITIQIEISKTLEKMEPELFTILPVILQDKNSSSKTRCSAAHYLGVNRHISRATISALIQILKDKKDDPDVRSSVCDALAWQASREKQILPTMLKIFTDEEDDATVRGKAGFVAGCLEPESKQITDSLLTLLQNRNEETVVRHYTVMALIERFKGDWRLEKESVAQKFIKISQNKDETPLVRLRVTAALGSLDPEGKRMLPILVDLLKNKEQHEYVRLGAVQGLAVIAHRPRNQSH